MTIIALLHNSLKESLPSIHAASKSIAAGGWALNHPLQGNPSHQKAGESSNSASIFGTLATFAALARSAY